MKPSLVRQATLATQKMEVKCSICGVSNQALMPSTNKYFICEDRSGCIARLQWMVTIYPEGVIQLSYDGISMHRLFYLNHLYETFLYTHRLEHMNDRTV